ncbi:MAG TPA: carboxymuconolactone decarboxylase family protein [Terriglobales bacterium]|nr:carboxymuconolactone decarboxylase family protein [Terriglobales bacterium]
MSLETLLDSIPAHAKDLKLNFSGVVTQQTDLTPLQAWGTVVASAYAAGNPDLLKSVVEAASQHLSEQQLDAAKGAAAIMGMNNIYYRFLHLTSNEKYKTLPARLRMNFMRTHGIDHLDFELWSTAVSAINGCGACVDSHEKTLRDKGVAEEKILAAVRIASVIHAIAKMLNAETALKEVSQPVTVA